jgi:hypothetical protein
LAESQLSASLVSMELAAFLRIIISSASYVAADIDDTITNEIIFMTNINKIFLIILPLN